MHAAFDTGTSGTVHTNGTAVENWGVSQQRHEATSAPSYADQMCGADRMRADSWHSDSSSHADSVDPKHVNQVLNAPTVLTVTRSRSITVWLLNLLGVNRWQQPQTTHQQRSMYTAPDKLRIQLRLKTGLAHLELFVLLKRFHEVLCYLVN